MSRPTLEMDFLLQGHLKLLQIGLPTKDQVLFKSGTMKDLIQVGTSQSVKQKQQHHRRPHLSMVTAQESCVPGALCLTCMEVGRLESLLFPAVTATYITLGAGPCKSYRFQKLPETCKFHLLPESHELLLMPRKQPHNTRLVQATWTLLELVRGLPNQTTMPPPMKRKGQ